MLSCLLPDPTLIAFDSVSYDEAEHLILCEATSTSMTAFCPLCLQSTSGIHSTYSRTLADLPWAGIPVRIALQVRRFFCRNEACLRKIFCERLLTVAAPWARRCTRLAKAQRAIGLAAGGAGGARLCMALAMDAGLDLLLALVRTTELTVRQTPRVLGVDDWARRKGHDYGTILVDLEQGCIVDVLPDRTAESLERWLRTHPGVEIVARDRAEAYAEGIRLGTPDALQVADRWHLLKNLTDAVYKALQKHQVAIQRMLLTPPLAAAAQAQPVAVERGSRQEVTASSPRATDLAREQMAEKAQDLQRQGWTVRAIARHLGRSPKTVRKYIDTELPLPLQRRSRRQRKLDTYIPYLLERWNAGCHNAAQLHREIEAQGFRGQVSIVKNFACELRKANGIPPRQRGAAGQHIDRNPCERPPTLRRLAHLVTDRPEQLADADCRYVEQLSKVHFDLELTVELAQTFADMARQRQVERLDGWLEQARPSPLNAFAMSLRQDEVAVRAALSLPWSNGPTEGHVNRLKCLKRQMYGRAQLDLLRTRLLAA